MNKSSVKRVSCFIQGFEAKRELSTVFVLVAAFLCFSHIASAQEDASPLPYDHYTTRTNDKGGKELHFYDSQNGSIATLTFNQVGNKVGIKTAAGEDGEIESLDEVYGGVKVHTETSSSGLSLKVRLTYASDYALDRPARVVTTELWQADQWHVVPKEKLEDVTKAERALFDTNALKLLYAIAGNLVQIGKPSYKPMSGVVRHSSRYGLARLLNVQSCPLKCRCSCVRITVFSPLYNCFQNALPDLCSCPACVGTWDLGCCCSATYSVCLVPCAAFSAEAEPLIDEWFGEGSQNRSMIGGESSASWRTRGISVGILRSLPVTRRPDFTGEQ